MSAKEVKEVVRHARKAGFAIRDQGKAYRITSKSGDFTLVHKTPDGTVSTNKAVANVKKFMDIQGLQRSVTKSEKNGIVGGECVECGRLPEQDHKMDCSQGREKEVETAPGMVVQFTCKADGCTEVFANPNRRLAALDLARHMRMQHPKQHPPQPCEYPGCDFIGKNPQSLSMHTRRTHGDLVGATRGESSRLNGQASPVTVRLQSPATPEGGAKVTIKQIRELATGLTRMVEGLSGLGDLFEVLSEDNARLRKENDAIQTILGRAIDRVGK